MSKELRELLQSLEEKKAKVRSLIAEDKVTEAEDLMEEDQSVMLQLKSNQLFFVT